jgi:glycine cleavage system aminomethyltransferase T
MKIMEKRKELYNYYKAKYPQINIDNNNFIKEYTSTAEEYKLLTNGVAIRDLSNYSKTFIHGKDSESLLKRLTTNKIDEIKLLQWVKTLFVNSSGNIIDRTLLMKFEDYYILVGSNTEEEKLYKWINRFVVGDDITISSSDDDYTLFEIMGRQAKSFMSMILGEKFDELNNKDILRVQLGNFFVHGIKINDCRIEKYILLVDSIHAVETLKIIEERKSVFDLGMIGENAYNLFRIENKIPAAPNELNDSVTPFEVNLHDEVSSEKQNYIGRGIIEDGEKNLAKLVKICFSNHFDSVKLPMNLVDNAGNEIGVVTSFSAHCIKNTALGLGLINSDFHMNGFDIYAISDNKKIKINNID